VGEGEARATVLVLHTLEMHVDISFSYLRFAEAASFDKKELRRSCTHILSSFKIAEYYKILYSIQNIRKKKQNTAFRKSLLSPLR
jgi:hypothetical protein